MGIKSSLDKRNSGAVIVDKQIGTSYDVVERVHDNLDNLEVLSDAIASNGADAAQSASEAAASALLASNSEDAAELAATSASQNEVLVRGYRDEVELDRIEVASNTLASQTAKTQAETAKDTAVTKASEANTSAMNASASASAASISEANASSSETNAAASALSAANSKDAASTSENNAATSETNAATSESNASTSETNAGISESNALNAYNSTALLFDNFDDRYLGAKSTPPTLDNDGNTLLVGVSYFDSIEAELKFWDGGSWTSPEAAASTAAANAATSATEALASQIAAASSESSTSSDATIASNAAITATGAASAASSDATTASTAASSASADAASALSSKNAAAVSETNAADTLATSVKKDSTLDTGAAILPVGTIAQRPSTPTQGMIRENSETGAAERYDGSSWTSFGGASGGPGNPIMYEHDNIVTQPYELTGNRNGLMALPISISGAGEITVSGNATLVMVG